MAKETPRDQPTNVATEDAPRPPDNAVVTSDTPQAVEESRAAGATSPPAAAGSDVTTSDTGSNNAPPAGDDDNNANAKPKRRDRASERRIKKLTGKLARVSGLTEAQQREIQRLKDENAALKTAAPPTPEPKLEDFKTPKEWHAAMTTWDAAQKPPRATPPARREPPADPPLVDPTIEAFHDAGRDMLGDEFDEALEEEGTAVSQVMAEFLFENEVGPAVYVHLANNQKDSRKIYDMTAPKALKALDELAQKAHKGELDIEGALQIAAPPDTGDHDRGPGKGGQQDGDPPPASAKNPGKTKAPTPPANTREPGDANLTPDPENEGMDEYAARRNKEIMRARGYPV